MCTTPEASPLEERNTPQWTRPHQLPKSSSSHQPLQTNRDPRNSTSRPEPRRKCSCCFRLHFHIRRRTPASKIRNRHVGHRRTSIEAQHTRSMHSARIRCNPQCHRPWPRRNHAAGNIRVQSATRGRSHPRANRVRNLNLLSIIMSDCAPGDRSHLKRRRLGGKRKGRLVREAPQRSRKRQWV